MKKIILLFGFILALFSCRSTSKITSEEQAVNTINNTATLPTEAIIEAEPEETVLVEVVNENGTIIAEAESHEEAQEIIETHQNNSITEAFNHSIWNRLLQNNVTSTGVVNYEGFRQQKGILREYIASLGAQMPEDNWTKEDKLAYWMNAYNAFTVDLIIRNMPLKSIKDINNPWKQRLWKLGTKWYNLDEIEHKILRKMEEPRIHFGINCASFSCPPLLNNAFTSAEVNEQLDALATNFINDSQRNTITQNKVIISKIFNWFGKDFKNEGSLIDFLNTYSETQIAPSAKVQFMEYNWDLNN